MKTSVERLWNVAATNVPSTVEESDDMSYAKMTIAEIVSLAREMARTLRNGIKRACHYLQSLRLPAEFACWALRGI